METTKRKSTKTLGHLLILIAFVIFGIVAYKNNARRHVPIVFSPKSMLDGLYIGYKDEYLEQGTMRTLDKQQNNITTSEGESYTMLRAVWQDDQPTFDASWKWTKDNLDRPNDKLNSWLFGKAANGTYEVLTDRGGQNSASDADTDIALALIFAFSRWKDNTYLGDAKALIADIWKYEVVTINGRPYMAANDVEKKVADKILINPSYLSPYAYKIFAKVDPYRDWNALASTSYEVMDKSLALNFGAAKSAGLPPDWISIDPRTGELSAPKANLSTNYGYDAMRVAWRLALDWQWNKDPRAAEILKKMSFIEKQWADSGILYATYGHDGSVVNNYESPAMYATALGQMMVTNSAAAKNMYETKLQSLYSPDTERWKSKLGYYDDNWAWFSIGLYNNLLPNLFTS